MYDGDSEKHMRQLLSGAIGEEEGIEAGSDVVEGFTDDIRLMPHQVRGVQWMKKRETGKNTGGILADVSHTCLHVHVMSPDHAKFLGHGIGQVGPGPSSCRRR